jgi:CDP-paratose 2-epimerase
MSVAIITGSAGLIGSEAVRWFASKGLAVVGIDNNMRKAFFGEGASTSGKRQFLQNTVDGYTHFDTDIRDLDSLHRIFSRYGSDIQVVIHTAAQPSHDWAARDPFADFSINANGTLGLLEMTRKFCPEAVFIFTSTNKVYGDTPNCLPLVECESRWELKNHVYAEHGIDETMSIDRSLHSLFGASKTAADILVQEYGRYFGINTASFRCGCLTGPDHAGAQLHGFLSYLMKCAITGEAYTVFGYKGKQVRDNLHAYDLVNAFWHFFVNPLHGGRVYNLGGGRSSSCSVLEAITVCEEITGRSLNWLYSEKNRVGDHKWWVTDCRRFESDYPGWSLTYDLVSILTEIYDSLNNKPYPLQNAEHHYGMRQTDKGYRSNQTVSL